MSASNGRLLEVHAGSYGPPTRLQVQRARHGGAHASPQSDHCRTHWWRSLEYAVKAERNLVRKWLWEGNITCSLLYWYVIAFKVFFDWTCGPDKLFFESWRLLVFTVVTNQSLFPSRFREIIGQLLTSWLWCAHGRSEIEPELRMSGLRIMKSVAL